MSRRATWLRFLIAWLPAWGLFTGIIATVHQATWAASAGIALRMIVAASFPGIVVELVAERKPWPRPMRARFVAMHALLSVVYAITLVLCNSLIESVLRRHMVIVLGPGLGAYFIVGIWLYIMIAGVSYTILAIDRVARAEANAARAQLAALRSQLNPHFLFNALHTVVQLIPREPKLAAQAAEQLAGLLRGAIEEDRDLVTVSEEWAFVERYLDIERIRFGHRLRVHVELSAEARDAWLPVFALQTLVENAVRHGAAPRVEPTDISIAGSVSKGKLTLVVRDSGGGASADQLAGSSGTGLKRLRDRLAVLYGTDAHLDIATSATTGFSATLVVPASGEP